MIKLYDTDYVLMKDGKPVEDMYPPSIYHISQVEEMLGDRFTTEDNEEFVSMTALPMELQEQYKKSIGDYEKEEIQGKVYDPPMSETDQYLLNKEREEEHKSYDY